MSRSADPRLLALQASRPAFLPWFFFPRAPRMPAQTGDIYVSPNGPALMACGEGEARSAARRGVVSDG